MNLIPRIVAIETWNQELTQMIETKSAEMEDIIVRQFYFDKWSLPNFNMASLQDICDMLSSSFLSYYAKKCTHNIDNKSKKRETIVLILDENDLFANIMRVMAIFLSGNCCKLHTTYQQYPLFYFLVKKMIEISPLFQENIHFSDFYSPFDRLIYTEKTSNFNYFSSYFKKYKTFLLSNKKSSVVITGKESEEEIEVLFDLLFRYFGNSVGGATLLYVPDNFDFQKLIFIFNHLAEDIASHHLYLNHLSYQKTIHLVNKVDYIDGGVILFIESKEKNTPCGIIHYQYYSSFAQLQEQLSSNERLFLFSQEDISLPHYLFNEKKSIIRKEFEEITQFLIEQNEL